MLYRLLWTLVYVTVYDLCILNRLQKLRITYGYKYLENILNWFINVIYLRNKDEEFIHFQNVKITKNVTSYKVFDGQS